MATDKVKIVCQRCNGSGNYQRTNISGVPDEVIPCPICGGDGNLVSAYLDLDDLHDKINEYVVAKLDQIIALLTD